MVSIEGFSKSLKSDSSRTKPKIVRNKIVSPLRELPRTCWEQKHEVYEDMLVYEWCLERVFFCKDCGKVWVCIERDGKIFVKEELPITISNRELGERLTWECE